MVSIGQISQSASSQLRKHNDVLGLLVAEGQEVTAETKFGRIRKRCAANDFDAGTRAEAHLQQPAFHFLIAADGDYAPPATDVQLIE
jgi:hypothetical protein